MITAFLSITILLSEINEPPSFHSQKKLESLTMHVALSPFDRKISCVVRSFCRPTRNDDEKYEKISRRFTRVMYIRSWTELVAAREPRASMYIFSCSFFVHLMPAPLVDSARVSHSSSFLSSCTLSQ